MNNEQTIKTLMELVDMIDSAEVKSILCAIAGGICVDGASTLANIVNEMYTVPLLQEITQMKERDDTPSMQDINDYLNKE